MTAKNSRFTDCLHVLVLNQFALVQPLLYRLSRKTVYLEDQGVDRATLLLLVGLLCLVPPVALWLIEALAELVSQRGRERTHLAIVFVLLTLVLWPVLRWGRLLPGMLVVALAPVLAALAVVAYRRYPTARLFVTATSPALLVFPAQFLFFSPVSRYLFPPPDPAPAPVAVRNPVPVVMLVFDEFCGTSLMNRQGEIDSARYPNFAALGETATWYRNASSVHPRTESALPAILTGRYPRDRRPATAAEYPENLFTQLASTGRYEFVVFEPYSRLCQPKLEEKGPKARHEQWCALARTLPFVYLDQLLPTDLPFALPSVPMEWHAVKRRQPDRPEGRTGVFRYHWNSDRAEQFEEFLRRIEPASQPALYFSHVVVPHFPWCFLPSGRKYTPDNGRQRPPPGTRDEHFETWGSDELAVLHGHQRYLLQVGYADHLLGKLMDRLVVNDLFDRCLLIVMADHGVSFRPGLSRRLPVDESLPDIASIPLLIKLPEQREGQTTDRNVETIDVLPTIREVLGLGGSPQSDGSSLLDTSRAERTQKLFYASRTMTLDAAFESKKTSWTRMLDSFGDGTEPERFFRIGPHGELVGHSVQEFAVSDRIAVEIEIAEPAIATTDDPTPIMPCFFSGRVKTREAIRQPIILAIAVNGTIQAVTRTYSEKKRSDAWTAMVPESAFQVGTNEVEILMVLVADERLTLHPVRDSPLRLFVAD